MVVEPVVVHRDGAVIIDRTPNLVMISVSIGGSYADGAVLVLALPGLIGWLTRSLHAQMTQSPRSQHILTLAVSLQPNTSARVADNRSKKPPAHMLT
jgi:hypothetical protein